MNTFLIQYSLTVTNIITITTNRYKILRKFVVSHSYPSHSASVARTWNHDVSRASLALHLGWAQYYLMPDCNHGVYSSHTTSIFTGTTFIYIINLHRTVRCGRSGVAGPDLCQEHHIRCLVRGWSAAAPRNRGGVLPQGLQRQGAQLLLRRVNDKGRWLIWLS